MSYFVQNLRRFAREITALPPGEIAARLKAAASVKLSTASQEFLAASGAGRLLCRRYRGRGVALMFHEIHEDVEAGLRMGCSPQQLRHTLSAAKAEGRDFVTADEALRRLADPQAPDFAVVTFDDAYRDNRDLALPILEEFAAPMTLFTPTGMVTRDIHAWWLGLRALFIRHDKVEIEAMGQRFPLNDSPSRNAALRQVTKWIGSDQSRADALKPTFRRYGISMPDLVAAVAMDCDEIRALAGHPLVTVAGHTTSHSFLACLDDEAARRDILDNKLFLEDLLERPVRHFAYPYGGQAACGPREAAYVKAAGYVSGFATRPGHLFPQHMGDPYLLPREDTGSHQSPARLSNRLTGVNRALATGFGNPVAGVT